MPDLRNGLAQRDAIEWRIIARNQGLVLDDIAEGDLLTALCEQMLRPQQVREVWEDLDDDARSALAQLIASERGVPTPSFQRRFGELRKIGPGRLQSEQPWKAPTGPGEVLWYLGWIVRGFQKTPSGVIEFISVPADLAALLPLDVFEQRESWRLTPMAAPDAFLENGEMLLDDLGTLLAYVQNHQVWLRSQGRWRMKDLQRLIPQLKLSSIREHPLEAGGPLHLIFFCAKKLGLLTERNRRHQFGRALRPWLEQSRGEQMRSLFLCWRDAVDWNDLCLAPGLHCQEGAWRNDPVLARKALLDQLDNTPPDQWFTLDELVAKIYEHQPDFQRPDGVYDTWYIQNAAGDFLRGFEHWPAVEGRLIRYIWQGPLFWLGVTALTEDGESWRLTPQGEAFLHDESVYDAPNSPTLRVASDYSITLAPNIGLWDRLRVALFAFWRASEPVYRYQITRRGLQRANKRGVSTSRILDFLERSSHGDLPDNVRKTLGAFRE